MDETRYCWYNPQEYGQIATHKVWSVGWKNGLGDTGRRFEGYYCPEHKDQIGWGTYTQEIEIPSGKRPSWLKQ